MTFLKSLLSLTLFLQNKHFFIQMKTNMKLILFPLLLLLFNGFSYTQCTGEDVRGEALTTMDSANDWVTSGVNVGNDVSGNSNYLINKGIATGISNFVAAQKNARKMAKKS
jgi:hypothetical protein